MSKNPIYDESSIKSLDWKEHIRQRPGMYIGKLGSGKSSDDGIYVLLKEIIDNLQAKNTIFQNQVKKLTIENKQLIATNKKLSIEVNCLKEAFKSKQLK